jgi:hypothetical protein
MLKFMLFLCCKVINISVEAQIYLSIILKYKIQKDNTLRDVKILIIHHGFYIVNLGEFYWGFKYYFFSFLVMLYLIF